MWIRVNLVKYLMNLSELNQRSCSKLIDLPGESYLATQFNTDVYSMLMMFEAICDYAHPKEMRFKLYL